MELEIATTRKCKKCNEDINIEDYYPGNKSTCRFCCSKRSNNRQKSLKVKLKDDIEGYIEQRLRAKKTQCKRDNIYFDLTTEEVVKLYYAQDCVCAFSKLPFNEKDVDLTLSLDRKDHEQGYTIKNLQLILNCLNKGKGRLESEAFKKIALAVADKHYEDLGLRVELVKI